MHLLIVNANTVIVAKWATKTDEITNVGALQFPSAVHTQRGFFPSSLDIGKGTYLLSVPIPLLLWWSGVTLLRYVMQKEDIDSASRMDFRKAIRLMPLVAQRFFKLRDSLLPTANVMPPYSRL